MTKFKVGDKVRILTENGKYGHNLSKGSVAYVLSVDGWYDYYDIEVRGDYEHSQWLPENEVELYEEKTMNVPYNITGNSIAVFYGGKMYQVPASDARYEPLKEALRAKDYDNLESLLDRAKHIERITCGLVEAGDGEVTYAGKPVHGALSDMLLRMIDEGFDPTPWAKFLDNLMLNPSYRSRTQLYGFLEKYDAPITEDGCFIAFKGVRMDYTDHHTGTMDNSIGQVVVMDRFDVDDDPNNTCSSGLHACATEYLDGGMFSGERIVVLKINPRDVVSIPTDYNFSKMRVCQYEVIDETTKQDMHDLWSSSVYA